MHVWHLLINLLDPSTYAQAAVRGPMVVVSGVLLFADTVRAFVCSWKCPFIMLTSLLAVSHTGDMHACDFPLAIAMQERQLDSTCCPFVHFSMLSTDHHDQ